MQWRCELLLPDVFALCEQMCAGCSLLFLAGGNSNKILSSTFRWRRVWVGFFRSIMCSNCIACHDLEIISYSQAHLAFTFMSHNGDLMLHWGLSWILFHCHKAIIIWFCFWVLSFVQERSAIYYSHHIMFTTFEVLDKCIIRKQSLLWRVYNPGRKNRWNLETKRCTMRNQNEIRRHSRCHD